MVLQYQVSGSGTGPWTPTDVDLREIIRVARGERPLFSLAGGTGGYVAKEHAARFLKDWDVEIARRNAVYRSQV